jgi:hypothetical protein
LPDYSEAIRVAELPVVEQELDVIVGLADFDGKLPAHKGEPLAQLEQEVFEPMEEARLQLPLVERLLDDYPRPL